MSPISKGFIRFSCCLLVSSVLTARAADKVYSADFTKAEVGSVPDDLLVLDGAFSVQEEGANRFLQLPGSPLESFGFLFGPTEKDGVRASAKIFGTLKGRRFPVMALGLNGAVPYRLQVAPAKKSVELFKGDELLQAVPFNWASGTWTEFRLQLLPLKEGGWRLEGKVWAEGSAEPEGWMLTQVLKDEPVAGRASVWGKPFSETPIRFDDLAVEKIP